MERKEEEEAVNPLLLVINEDGVEIMELEGLLKGHHNRMNFLIFTRRIRLGKRKRKKKVLRLSLSSQMSFFLPINKMVEKDQVVFCSRHGLLCRRSHS